MDAYGSQIRCLEYENVHVKSEIASTLHFTLYIFRDMCKVKPLRLYALHFTFWGLGMGETDITNKSNLDITRRIEWGLQNYQLG